MFVTESLPNAFYGPVKQASCVEVPYPVNFYELIPHLLNLYPGWSEDDVLSFLEEKTGRRVHPEDQITLRAVHRRHRRNEREFQG